MKKFLILVTLFLLVALPVSAAGISASNKTPKNNPCDKKVVPDDVYADFRAAVDAVLGSEVMEDIKKQINEHTDSKATVPIEIHIDDLEGFKKQYVEDTDGLTPPGTKEQAENIYNSHPAYTYVTDNVQKGVQVIRVKFFCQDDLRIRTLDNNATGGWDLYEEIIHELVHAKLYSMLVLGVDESKLPFNDHDDDPNNDDKEKFFDEVKRLLEKLLKDLKNKGLISYTGLVEESESIRVADLGIEEPGLLPTNPFYFLKEWGRGVRRFFTFGSVAKIELDLGIANEKAAEAKRVQELTPKDAEAVREALENYSETQERLQDRFESLRETSENPNVDRLLERLADRVVRHEKIFDEIAKRMEDRDEIAKIVRETKEKIEEVVAEAAGKDDPAKFASKLEKAFIEVRGGDLKHIRSVEIIDRVSQKAPEAFQESLGKLREEFTERLKKDVEVLVEKADTDAVRNALEELPGDVGRHAVILEELRQKAAGRVAEAVEKGEKAFERLAEEEKRILERAMEQIARAEERLEKLKDRMSEQPFVPAAVINLFDEANLHLQEARNAFSAEKYGEAFGQAKSAEVLARNGLRLLERGKPKVEQIKEDLGELAARVAKYEEVLRSKGWTPESHPQLYALLGNARQHLGFAEDALAKNSLEGTILHIGHVRGFLRDLARQIERESDLRGLSCDEIKERIRKLDELLKNASITREQYVTEYSAIAEELEVCRRKEAPAPAARPASIPTFRKPEEKVIEKTVEAERREERKEMVCIQVYDPVCGADSKTYSNKCEAERAGVPVKYSGKCEEARKEAPTPTAPTPAPAEERLKMR